MQPVCGKQEIYSINIFNPWIKVSHDSTSVCFRMNDLQTTIIIIMHNKPEIVYQCLILMLFLHFHSKINIYSFKSKRKLEFLLNLYAIRLKYSHLFAFVSKSIISTLEAIRFIFLIRLSILQEYVLCRISNWKRIFFWTSKKYAYKPHC